MDRARIAEAFGVREDTVRLWRSDFMRGGVAALQATVAPGTAPVTSEAALRVAIPLLVEPVADRPNWTIPRLCAEPRERSHQPFAIVQGSGKKYRWRRPQQHAEGTPDRSGRRTDWPASALLE